MVCLRQLLGAERNCSLGGVSPQYRKPAHWCGSEELHGGIQPCKAPRLSRKTSSREKSAVIKHCDDGSTKIETPEVGAEFEVYLKAAGSYENAEKTERDILVCDENGFAETKDLPYGEYTMRQTKGWEGKELLEPFNVYISEDGKIYRFLINNAPYEALIEIVKKDAETGKIIPAAGIGFKVRNTDTGEYIVQHINYPDTCGHRHLLHRCHRQAHAP